MVDGSTSKTPHNLVSGMSNGRLCMQTVCKYVATMDAGTTVEDFCRGVTQALSNEYIRLNADIDRLRRIPHERPTASAAVYSAARGEIWLVGDCQCMVNGTLYDNPKPCEAELAEERSQWLKRAIENGMTVSDIQTDDPGRRHILPQLMASCAMQNVSYAVIDGFSIPVEHVRVVSGIAKGTDIVIASDGYPCLKPTLEESEQALARLIEADPLCISLHKATKGLMRGNLSFDDRSYIRLTT